MAVYGPAFADHHEENEDAPRVFEAMDVFELEVASSPSISPDGSKIIYVRAANDIMSDGTRSNLWIMNGDGSDNRPLLSGRTSYGRAAWSPDGTRIAYVSGLEGSPQLYVRISWGDGVTSGGGVTGVVWHADKMARVENTTIIRELRARFHMVISQSQFSKKVVHSL